MKKDLYLIRHAMSEDKEQYQKDIERALTSDGMQAATRTGHFFKQEGITPDLIITSPAERALDTATLMAEQLNYSTEQIHINDELYEASVRTFLQVINRLKDSWNQVFIIGHNPTISYLAEYITGSEVGSVAPSGHVHIRLPFDDWEAVSEGNTDLIEYTDPTSYQF